MSCMVYHGLCIHCSIMPMLVFSGVSGRIIT